MNVIPFSTAYLYTSIAAIPLSTVIMRSHPASIASLLAKTGEEAGKQVDDGVPELLQGVAVFAGVQLGKDPLGALLDGAHGLAGLLLERRGVKGAGVPDLNQDVDDLLLLFVGDHVGQIVVFDLVVDDRDDLVLGDV